MGSTEGTTVEPILAIDSVLRHLFTPAVSLDALLSQPFLSLKFPVLNDLQK